MGTTLDCWIEYDDDAGSPPFSDPDRIGTLPLDYWYDLRSAKDYPFYGAISGARNETGIAPLYPVRGMPPNASRKVREEACDVGDMDLGWLHTAEVHQALKHQNVRMDHLSLELHCVLNMLEYFSRELGDDRVRFVFYIE